RDDLAGLNSEAHAVEHSAAEIGVRDTLEREHRHLFTPQGRAASRQRSSSARIGCTTPYSTMKMVATMITTQAIDWATSRFERDMARATPMPLMFAKSSAMTATLNVEPSA